jgi:mono/diheme cytochrome c family protein
MNLNKYFIAIIAFIAFSPICLKAQNWLVPEDKAQKASPFKFSDETQHKGETLYQRNCQSCHGTPAKANFAGLTPTPGDPATEKFSKQSDGALFFKITNGRGVMPQFKDVLTDDERWQVISYFRSFHKGYVQPEPATMTTGKYGGLNVKVAFEYQEKNSLFKLTATGYKDTAVLPLSGVELKLFANRYFGSMQIGETQITNSKGEAWFEYKNPLPGDSVGNIALTVKVTADGLDVKKSDTLKAGVATHVKSLIDTRAMWSVRSKAPWWVMLSYSLVVLSVWIVIIYIVLQIVKIRKLGKKE